MFEIITADIVEGWNAYIGYLMFYIGFVYLAFELIRYAVKGQMSWNLAGDSLTNYITLAVSVFGGYYLYYALETSTAITAFSFALFDIQVTWANTVACVVLADLAYYWEHRFTHRVSAAWATHSVHHSSPHYNISVAYRFGPMDLFWAIFFNLPLIFIGFDPLVVAASASFVQVYQTILHTEAIPKLWRWIEFIMNTPSHHRAHHGRNPQYMDRNYAGIFIVWDRMFGTFAEEIEPVDYGITDPLNTLNPVPVLFHGFTRLTRQLWDAGTWRARVALLVLSPDRSVAIIEASQLKK